VWYLPAVLYKRGDVRYGAAERAVESRVLPA
jgi:hypothetical protein